MKYTFGPVPSRRLGRSLGVDPIPLKTCNWNCVYCQLGRTSPLANQRRDYFPPEAIIADVKTTLASHGPGQIDWLTFVGSGEPTLHASLGWMIQELKAYTEIPLAVITNGSLLYLPEVRRALLPADAVLPTLDAGSERLYQRIDRPVAGLTFERLVEGMIALRREFDGKLWIEVMLINGLNDSVAALEDLATVIQRIQPDDVHINLPVRPPTESSVEVPSDEAVVRAQAILGEVAHVVPAADVEVDFGDENDLADSVMEIVKRHPMSEVGLVRAIKSRSSQEVAEALAQLSASGRARVTTHNGERFWSDAKARYRASR
ncbi:MAG: radical SAM protein [Pirellulaceae bacterium]|jgi:wyosine [tRNA(Phe)-imidazoG37] synthetase (radical SAM superfamily)|nr:radical SAM protein [Pirellulaceae bacterium]HJN10542.1 radical SAM protein [Pirellulaceae bacterium]